MRRVLGDLLHLVTSDEIAFLAMFAVIVGFGVALGGAWFGW